MEPAPLRDDEAQALKALRLLDVLDSPPEAEFDALVRVASLVCETPIALISLLDHDRQWFLANHGLPGVTETPRDLAFCAHAVRGTGLFEVGDTLADQRFADNPLVTGAPGIRAYAGVPLQLQGGEQVGTLCVIHRQAHTLSATQREVLEHLARAATRALQTRQSHMVLAQQNQRLANVIEATETGTWEWHLPSDAFRVNAHYARISGCAGADTLPARAQAWWQLMHPDDAGPYQERLRQHLSTRPVSPAGDAAEPVFMHELRVRHGDGAWTWVLDRGRVMSRSASGEPLWMFGRRTDISERKRREHSDRRNRDFLQRTGRAAGVGGWELDLITGELVWSDETRHIHGVPADYQPVLETAIDFYAPEARPVISGAVEQAIQTGQGWDLELPLVRADGRRIWARAVGNAQFEGGRPVRLSGAFQDITERKTLALQLQIVSDEAQDLYDNAPCAYHSLDEQGVFLKINAVGLAWLGCRREELIGRCRLADFFTDEGRALFAASFETFKRQGHIDDLELDLVSRDGSRRHVSVTATLLRDEQGGFVMSRTAMFDVTEVHRIREQLARITRQQQAMLDNDLVGIVKLRNLHSVWKNRALTRIFGYSDEELVGQPSRMLYPSEEAYAQLGREAYPVLRAGGVYRAQIQMRHKDGRLIWIDLSGTLLDAANDESMWLMVDITQMKTYQQHVEQLAFHDALTGLPNRLLLADRLQQAIHGAEREGGLLALCFVDLDGFKAVNDEHGHDAGDLLLKEIGRRLLQGLRSNDTVARLGGDEFVLLLASAAGREEALAIAQRMLQGIQQPVALTPQTRVSVAASLGVAMFPEHGRRAEQLMAAADQAMFEAKRAGRGRVVFAGQPRPA
jgi:diguanylate cyclase (GGDEF)-like protein/PAS domain S-box-containing protein